MMTTEERLQVLEDLLNMQLNRLENLVGVEMDSEDFHDRSMISEFGLALDLLDRIDDMEAELGFDD